MVYLVTSSSIPGMLTLLMLCSQTSSIFSILSSSIISLNTSLYSRASPVIENDIAKYSQLATNYLLFHDYSDSPIHRGVKEALDNWHCEDFKKTGQVDTIAIYQRVKPL